MNLRLTPIALAAALLGTAAAAQAQQPAPKAPARQAAKEAAPEPIAKVEIKGSAEEYDARRDDTASKTVMNHEEIIKYGDTNVFDVRNVPPA